MTGSFSSVIKINNHGHILPNQQQPLKLDAGATVTRIDAWVLQRGGYCIASVRNPIMGPEEVWLLNPNEPGDYFGERFKKGAAIGVGLLVLEKAGNKVETYSWMAPVELKLV